MYSFAVLPYVNAAPLVRYISQCHPKAKLTYFRPCDTVLELTRGNADAAIVPIVDFFLTPSLEMISGLGICADGNVESVLLQCKCPLDNVKSIKLDAASRTSNLLLKILIKRHFKIKHEIESGYDIPNPDAEVMIGNRALQAEPAFENYDLAGEGKKMTGLPFVFAVWAYRNGHPNSRELTEILYAAKQAGCSDIENISKQEAEKLGISRQRCYRYLTECLHYDTGNQHQTAMKLFWQLSKEFINEHTRPMEAIRIQSVKDYTHAHKERKCV